MNPLPCVALYRPRFFDFSWGEERVCTQASRWSIYNKEKKMFVTLTNRIDQKQTTAAENKLFVLKKYVTRNNSPELPVDGNIIGQISISRIVILKKKRKTNFSHLCYWTAQRQQRQERKKVAKSFLAWPCICMNLRSGRHFGAFIDLILVP